MAQKNWFMAFAATEVYEGWHKFSNNPRDPGGATFDGVTQGVYNAWRRREHLPVQAVRLMEDDECRELMKVQYWDVMGGDGTPSGVDVMLYDIAVNSGPEEATRLLQKALGVKVDGHWGLVTGHALSVADPARLILGLDSGRKGFWRSLRTWWTFGRGWSAREAKVRVMALKLASPMVDKNVGAEA